MSDFEFVSVVLAIVIGLGMTRILSGLASVLEHRATLRPDWISLTWAVTVLLWQILFWVGTVNSYRSKPITFTVANFGLLLLAAVALYFAAALVLPSQIGPRTDLRQHYAAVRKPFFLVLLGLPLLELSDSLQHGFRHLLDLGPAYLVAQGFVILVCFRALATESRRTHGVIAVGFLGGIMAWLFTRLFVI
jgi:hypothetical protein